MHQKLANAKGARPFRPGAHACSATKADNYSPTNSFDGDFIKSSVNGEKENGGQIFGFANFK